MLAIKPMISVTANPLIALVPNRKRNTPEISAARCVSTSVINTREKLVATEETTVFPALNYSRIRSKIRTFESMPTPIVRMTPAMPGSVSVEPRTAIAPNSTTKFSNIAIEALMPDAR